MLPLEFMVDGTLHEVMLPCAFTVTGVETYAAAGLAGFGLIQAPRYRFAKELASGALQVVLPDHPPRKLPVSALYPAAKHLSPRVRVFVDWLVEALREAR